VNCHLKQWASERLVFLVFNLSPLRTVTAALAIPGVEGAKQLVLTDKPSLFQINWRCLPHHFINKKRNFENELMNVTEDCF